MRSDRLYLEDIVSAAETIERFSTRLVDAEGMDKEIVLGAILQKLLEIGEAAARISPSTKLQFSAIDWQDIVGFRNYAIHAYFSIDWQIVRSAAFINAPRLERQVANALQVLDEGSDA